MGLRAFAGRIGDVVQSREEGGRYSWRLGLGAMAGMLVPLLIGISTDHVGYGKLIALSAVLFGMDIPRGSTAARVRVCARRTLLFTAAAALGIWVAGNLPATVAAIALISLLVPVHGIGSAPLILLVLAAQPAAGVDNGVHIALFAIGSLWGALIILLPFITGPHTDLDPSAAPVTARQAWTVLRTAAGGRTPQFRYAVRLAVCFTLAFVLIEAVDLPHGTWVLIGIVTTMRPSWGQTNQRIIKRLAGTVIGAAIGAALLTLSDSMPQVLLAVLASLFGGIARPMRQVNYTLWTLFWAPATLLLLTFGTHAGWIDAAERLGNNALGAALAALATLLLWPHHEETNVPGRIALLLSAQARWLDRAASLIGRPLPQERLHTRRGVEAAEADLTASRARLAAQPHPAAGLLAELDATTAASVRLRELIHAHYPYTAPELPFTADELRRIAGELRDTADQIDGIDGAGARPDRLRGEVPATAADLMAHATAAAAAGLRARTPQRTA